MRGDEWAAGQGGGNEEEEMSGSGTRGRETSGKSLEGLIAQSGGDM